MAPASAPPASVVAENAGLSGGAEEQPFTLDVSVLEKGDLGGLVRLTDDGCGSTCTACTTN